MAKQTIVTLTDDIDGTEAVETVAFSIDGVAYEIDLSEKNAATLRRALAPYISRARTAGSSRPPAQSWVAVPAVGQSRTALIRAWAAAQGLTVPARGRIPQSVVTAYDAAN